MPKVNLGRVGFVLQGNHSTTKTYKRLDCVMYNNATYAAIEDVPTGTAITNTQYWQLLIDANGILQDIDAFKDHLIMVQDTEPTEADNRLWIKSTQGDEVQIPTWAEHEALAGEVDKKTIKHLLTYDGTNIKEDSTVLTYAAIHAMLMDKPDFVVLVYNERAYHPTRVSNDQIVFIASFVSNGYPTMDRISISNKDVVTVTTGTAEMKVNKVSSVNDANKADADKYPSVKAVVDYVQPTIDETTKIKSDIAQVDGAITRSKSAQMIDENAVVLNMYNTATSFAASAKHRIVQVACEPETTYTASRQSMIGQRFIVFETANAVAVGEPILVKHETFNHNAFCQYVTFKTSANTHYISIMFYNGNVDGSVAPDELLSYIKIEEGGLPTNGRSVYTFEPTPDYALPFIGYNDVSTIFVSDDVRTNNDTIGNGWTKNGNSLVHAAGNDAQSMLSITLPVSGDLYLVDMDTTYTTGEFITVRIGNNSPESLVYTGQSHLRFVLYAQSTGLYIKPYKDGVDKDFTISNITVRRIQPTGTPVEIERTSVMTVGHESNLGFRNVFIGECADKAVGSTRSIIIGHDALEALTAGHRNIVLGTCAARRIPGGENNIVVGSDTMEFVRTKANNNIAIGHWAMEDAVNPEMEIAIGQNALQKVEGENNTAVGKFAGFNTNTGKNNAYFGYYAGYRNRSGNGNLCLGYNAFGCNGGSNNTFVGANSYSDAALENVTAIGAGTRPTKDNQVMIGNASVQEVIIAGKKIKFNADGTVTWENI